LQTKTCPEGTTNYDYDGFGNLRHVALPDGTAIDYVIDGQNRRVGKKVNGVMVEGFLYRNQLQPAAWLNGDGTVKARFIYAAKANVPEYMVTSAGATYRLVTDQVGSVRLVEDTASGAVVERIDWDEFGNVLTDSASGTQPFGFAGGLRDFDTGLTRFGARDYDAVTGRWTNKDPILFDGEDLNIYAYCRSDPVNYTDEDGVDRHINPRPGGPSGPTITFNNDTPGGPSTDLAVDDDLADMIESVAVQTGISFNINSSRGGVHSKKSYHYVGKAVDINQCNGKGVNSRNPAARTLQEAFALENNIVENFGPFQNTKTLPNGSVRPWPKVAREHRTHLHAAVR